MQPHGPNLLMWYSLAGMLSASVGAWVVTFAKFAWERLEHILLPSSLQPLQVRAAWAPAPRETSEAGLCSGAESAAGAPAGAAHVLLYLCGSCVSAAVPSGSAGRRRFRQCKPRPFCLVVVCL